MNAAQRNILKKILFPVVIFRRKYLEHLSRTNPEKATKIFYKRAMGKPLDLNDPRDLNEKLQWIKLYSDTSLWARLSDKYAVREYLREQGMGNLLTELYGVWDSADDIDFDALPDSFVLKANHDSGSYILVKDKSKIDREAVRSKAAGWLERTYGILSVELHYREIKPKIIAEQFLNGNEFSSTVVDYKFFCVHGEPQKVMVCYDRKASTDSQKMMYDMDWNLQNEYFLKKPLKTEPTPQPATFTEMIELARKLSAPFPFVRVDFYDSDNRIYFGEMTFLPHAGVLNYHTQKFLDELGEKIDINKIKRAR